MITWNDQGLSRIHKHERDSFEPGVVEHREHSGVEGGDLYADDEGNLLLRDPDGHHRIVGEVDGHHYDALRQDRTDDDVEISVDHEPLVTHAEETAMASAPRAPTPRERIATLESGMSDLSAKMDQILAHLTGG